MNLRAKLKSLFCKNSLDADMAEEMRFHIEQRTESNIAAGMTAEEAHFAARRSFGGEEQLKERARDDRGWMWLDHFWRDLRHAFRQLRKSPGFTAVTVLTLGLGIGANIAIFSLINGVMFRPVMSRDSGRLARVYQHDRDHADRFRFFSYPDYAELRAHNEAFADLFAFGFVPVGVREADVTQKVSGCLVSANYFAGLGVSPALGRAFLPEEEAGGSPVAILTHAFWLRLGGDPSIVGRKILLSRGEVTVVGVMPSGFSGALWTAPALFFPLGLADYLAPSPAQPAGRILTDRDDQRLMLMGRLKPGVTLAKARSEMAVLQQRFPYPDESHRAARSLIVVPPARGDLGARPGGGMQNMVPLAALAFGLSILVLSIACINLANMMLVRGAGRRKEIAVRLALGASRHRILRQLLTEGLLLAALGSVAGFFISTWCTNLLSNFLYTAAGTDFPQFDFSPDGRVLIALLGVSVLATLFFALGPAWKLAGINVNEDLKGLAGTALESRSLRFAPRDFLAVGQIALALVLLVAAALFARSAMNAARANLGFEFGSNFYVSFDPSLTGDSESRARILAQAATDRLATLPGVESVSSAMSMPFGELLRNARTLQLAGAPPPSPKATTFAEGKLWMAYYNVVGADYFRTLGAPLLRGRDFERGEADRPGSRVVILSKNCADVLWPGLDPIGRSIQFPGATPGTPPTILTVVGIAPDINWDILNKEYQAWMYLPLGQEPWTDLRLHVRVAPGVDPAPLMASAREELRRLDARITPKEIKTLAAVHRDGPVRVFQIGSFLFGAFGTLAIMLSFLGIYGLKAYAVTCRTREIGIRLALGANPGTVIGMILRESVWLAGLGLGLGLLLAVGAGNAIARFLYRVPALDPWTYVVVPLLLLGVVLLACWIPARRATRISPLAALRE